MDHGHAAHQLGQAFLQLFAVVIGGGFFHLGADLLHAGLDFVGLAGAVNDGGVFLLDHHALGGTQVVEGHVFQLGAGVVRSHLAVGQDGDILQHGLAAVTEAGGLDGHDLQGATQLIDHQGSQGFAFHVFGQDHQRTIDLGDLFEHGQHVLHAGDLLLSAQDVGVVHLAFHLLRVGHEVGREIATVEAHAFHHVHGGFQALGFFNGDHAFLAHLGHGFGDDVADGGVGVGRDGTDLGDFLLVAGGLGQVGQFADQGFHALVDAALDGHGIAAGSHQLHAFVVDGLSQDGGGGGTVTGGVGGLGGDFLHQLGAHVLELVVQFDFLGDGHAVLGDDGSAEGLFDGNVTTLGAEGHLHGIGQLINTTRQFFAGFHVEENFFSGHYIFLLGIIEKRRVCMTGAYALVGQDGEDVFFAHHQMVDAVQLDFGAGVLVEEHLITLLDGQFNAGAVFQDLAGTGSDHLTLAGLFLGGVGDVQTAGGLFFGFQALDQHTIVQGLQFHGVRSSKNFYGHAWVACTASAGRS